MGILDRVEEALGDRPVGNRPLIGGSIADVQLLTMASGDKLVAKVVKSNATLTVEAYMLRFLQQHSQLPVPEIVYGSDDLLLLNFVEGESVFSEKAQLDAAEQLARLHNIQAPRFGFEQDTVIGSFPQPNPWNGSWLEFFAEQRLLYMAKLCLEVERLPASYMGRIESFCQNLENWLLEPTSSSLIHGDIWTTNLLADRDRIVAFLDPAIYFGNPEIELAYIALFGTFTELFFRRYQAIRPLAPGFFETRLDIYNLYPLLVHVRHFGGSYLNSVDRTLTRFGF